MKKLGYWLLSVLALTGVYTAAPPVANAGTQSVGWVCLYNYYDLDTDDYDCWDGYLGEVRTVSNLSNSGWNDKASGFVAAGWFPDVSCHVEWFKDANFSGPYHTTPYDWSDTSSYLQPVTGGYDLVYHERVVQRLYNKNWSNGTDMNNSISSFIMTCAD